MADTIFLLNNLGELVEMTESHYLTEDDLQKLLADYPKLIPGDQVDKDNPRRWLLISREMGVADSLNSANRWSLDHLFIDQDGVPTLVEVKRSSDTRLRREVIGQILDYAANAVGYWSVEEILVRFEKTCEVSGRNPEDVLGEFLLDNAYQERFWDVVQTNLLAGKIRLLIIADVIPKEMQRIIEFLNEQMSQCEILGIEIKQFVGQNLKTLVPRVIGATANAQSQKSFRTITKGEWNEEKFFTALSTGRDGAQIETYRKIYEKSSQLFDGEWWGQGSKTGSYIPNFRVNGQLFQLFGIYTYGGVELQFQWLKTKKPFDDEILRTELRDRLSNALQLQIDTIDKRPNIKIDVYEKLGVIDAFFDVARWYINIVRAYYANAGTMNQ